MDLDHIHNEEFNILCEIDRLCKKNNIKYFLHVSGTLLGAIRHKGFVPWDDDLDIAMFRNDYEKFIKIAHRELNSPFILCESRYDSRYTNIFAKVFKTDAIYSSKYYSEKLNLHGLWVDIFPIDYIKAKNRPAALKKVTKRVKIATFLRIIFENRNCLNKELSLKMRFLCTICKLIPESILLKIINMLFSIDKRKNSNFCTCYASNYLKELFPIDCYLPLKTVTFEKKEFFAPNNPDVFLKNAFGNYLELPPLSERKPSHDLILTKET